MAAVGAVFGFVKSAAVGTFNAAKEGVSTLTSRPTKITCKQCKNDVMVPPTTYNWTCPGCNSSNTDDKDKCVTCQASRPSILDRPDFTVLCTMCNTVNIVPSTNASKYAIAAGRTTKNVAVAVGTGVKNQFNDMKSRAAKFNCENCNAELENPNPPPLTEEEKAANPNLPPLPPDVEVIKCPVCHRNTSVPSNKFKNTMRKGGASISKTLSKVYYGVAGKAYANCPICQTANLIPHVAPAGAPGVAQAAAVPVQIRCSNCGTEYPASAKV